MGNSLTDLPALLRTPAGRGQFRFGLYRRAWPLMSRVASAYRLSLARKARIIAVVGTFGKTTTTRAVLAALGGNPDVHTGFNASSHLASAVLRIGPGQRHAVVEVGIARRGEMAPYARLLRPDVAVVTSIGSEHNPWLGTLEATRAEKAVMVRALPPSGLAVLNGDDPHVRWMQGETGARVRTFGFGEGSHVRAAEAALDWPRGTVFRLNAGGQTRRVRIRLLGRHQVYAILAALTVALEEGFDLDCALEALEALRPTQGRLEVLRLENGALLLRDDYKASLETIDAALDVLAEVPARRRILVLGEIDDPPGSSRLSYQRLGERVGRIATRAMIIGTGESFQLYLAGARRAGLGADTLVHAGTSVQWATDLLRRELMPGDVILIKGRWGQRLDRVALALAGRHVVCDITSCSVRWTRCERCPMLERGWGGLRVMT
jgi:UDP-N-acetylmuramoyl-tripeptide--D-alanyl-D-alanine ligase